MRIATFNLKDFFDPRSDDERPIVEQKIQHVATLLRRARADVVALQEVASDALLDRLVRHELADLDYRTIHAAGRDRRGIGCAILSRLPVLSQAIATSERIALPLLPGSSAPVDLAFRRPIPVLEVDAGAFGYVAFITVHFKSKLATQLKDDAGAVIAPTTPRAIADGHVRSLLARTAEALFVREVVDAWLEKGRRVVVLGDFNDTIDSFPVRIVAGDFPPIEPKLRLTSCTTRVPDALRFSILHGGTPDLIDHILLSADLVEHLDDVIILNDALRDHGPYVPDAPIAPDSDHAPVVAAFALRPMTVDG